MQPMVEEVLSRGHEVTAIIFNGLKIGHKNYTEIVVPNAFEKVLDKFSEHAMEEGGLKPWTVKFWQTVGVLWSECIADLATLPLTDGKVQKFHSVL